jgi:hypothetical protein
VENLGEEYPGGWGWHVTVRSEALGRLRHWAEWVGRGVPRCAGCECGVSLDGLGQGGGGGGDLLTQQLARQA